MLFSITTIGLASRYRFSGFGFSLPSQLREGFLDAKSPLQGADRILRDRYQFHLVACVYDDNLAFWTLHISLRNSQRYSPKFVD